jgi:hypothetical protein
LTPSSPEILRDRGRSLEDEFFRREDPRAAERHPEAFLQGKRPPGGK